MARFDSNKIRSQISRKNTTKQELLKIYRRVAKMADQRMVRLESLSGQKNFKNILKYSYKKAAFEAAQWGANPMKPRFNIKPPTHKSQIQAKINDILNFLDKPSSTKQGIIDIYQKRADSLNKNEAVRAAGLQFSWQDVGEFFESKLYKKMAKSFGSETNIKAIGIIKQNQVEVLKAFKADQKNHVKTADNRSATHELVKSLAEDDIVIQEAINKMTENYSADVKRMLKILV